MSDVVTAEPDAEVKPASKFTKPGAPKRPVIDGQALKLFEQVRRTWHVKVPAGVEPHDLLLPELWRLLTVKAARHDIIHVLSDREDWECECRVESVTPAGVEVSISKKISRKAFALRETMLGDGEFFTRYQGGSWNVLRARDGYPVITGHATESAAIAAWLKEQPMRRTS